MSKIRLKAKTSSPQVHTMFGTFDVKGGFIEVDEELAEKMVTMFGAAFSYADGTGPNVKPAVPVRYANTNPPIPITGPPEERQTQQQKVIPQLPEPEAPRMMEEDSLDDEEEALDEEELDDDELLDLDEDVGEAEESEPDMSAFQAGLKAEEKKEEPKKQKQQKKGKGKKKGKK